MGFPIAPPQFQAEASRLYQGGFVQMDQRSFDPQNYSPKFLNWLSAAAPGYFETMVSFGPKDQATRAYWQNAFSPAYSYQQTGYDWENQMGSTQATHQDKKAWLDSLLNGDKSGGSEADLKEAIKLLAKEVADLKKGKTSEGGSAPQQEKKEEGGGGFLGGIGNIIGSVGKAIESVPVIGSIVSAAASIFSGW